MLNVSMRVADDRPHVLVIEVDLSKEFGPSSSGKSIIVASTQGNVPGPEASGVMIGLNVYKPLGRKKDG